MHFIDKTVQKYLASIFIFAVEGKGPLRKTCDAFDQLWNQGREYQYEFKSGSFCSDASKGPYWFECDVEILPNVTFFHNRNETCLVDMDLGPSNEKNVECLNAVADILKSDDKQFYLLWLVHGFQSGPNELLQKSYVEKYQTDEIDMLVALVNWNKDNLGKCT